jgi:hypothetical protein
MPGYSILEGLDLSALPKALIPTTLDVLLSHILLEKSAARYNGVLLYRTPGIDENVVIYGRRRRICVSNHRKQRHAHWIRGVFRCRIWGLNSGYEQCPDSVAILFLFVNNCPNID